MATSTWVRNFIDLHTHLSGAVKEFHVIIRNLAPHPHAGAIQTLVIGMTSYIENVTQTFDDLCTQSQRGPPFDPTMIVIMQDTMSKISEQVKGLHLLHALALTMFENMQTTNSSDHEHGGPPPQTQDDSSDSGHQEPVGNRGMVKDFATALLDELERLGADVTEHRRRLRQNSAVPQIDVCQPKVTEAHSEAVVEQDGSHLNPKITLGQLSECPPQVDTCQHSVPETVNDKHGSKTVITQVRPNSYPPMTPGQHIECLQTEMQCKSKCIKTERLGQDMVKSQLPDLNKTNSKGHSTHKSMKKKNSAQHKTKFMRHGQNTVQYISPHRPKTKFRAQLQKVKINQNPNKKKKSNTNQILMARLSDHKIPDHSLTSNALPNKPRFKTRYK